MIILFAPSEGKKSGGDGHCIDSSSFILEPLFEKRMEVIRQYEIQVASGKKEYLEELFGVKDPLLLERYSKGLIESPTMKAILRYDGVAYDYLDYDTIGEEGKDFLDKHLIIFSNLFGPIGAGDLIPDYKLKQGSAIGKFAPEKFYKHHFSEALEEYIKDEEILDLRAGFYDKFFTPSSPVNTMKFLKNGKSVSHWAKAYRGIVLRHIACSAIQSLSELESMKIQGLELADIIGSKKKREYIYNILEN